MLNLAKARLLSKETSTGVQPVLVAGDVAKMSFSDSQFDTVIDTFSLCVTEEPLDVIREMKRVIKPDGKVVLLENTRSDGLLGWFQDITEPVVTPLSKNCKWNTDVQSLAKQAGLQPDLIETYNAGSMMLGVYHRQ